MPVSIEVIDEFHQRPVSFKFHKIGIEIIGKIKLTHNEIIVAKLNFPMADIKLCIAKENHLVRYVVA